MLLASEHLPGRQVQPPPGQVPLHGQVHPPTGTLTREGTPFPPAGTPLREQCMLGGTHPTRMHSCVIFVWLMTDVRQVSTMTFLKQAQFHSFLCFKSSVIALRHVYTTGPLMIDLNCHFRLLVTFFF